MTAVSIPSLIASSRIDSISYPSYSIDTEGTKIVTITKSQQIYLTKSILELEKCQDLNLNYKAANILLLEESATCKALVTAHELQDEASSIIIDAQKEQITNLKQQIQLNNKIYIALEQSQKKKKRKLLGWKIGTFTVIGIFAIALPTTIAIMSK
jgi:hypothetical protein